MSLKDYNSRTNRVINPDAGLTKKQIEQRNKYRAKGVASFIAVPKKKKNVKVKSYKDKTGSRYKLGPLDKLLKYDKTKNNLLTLNSTLIYGKYKDHPVSEVFTNDKDYLINLAHLRPEIFSSELLKTLQPTIQA